MQFKVLDGARVIDAGRDVRLQPHEQEVVFYLLVADKWVSADKLADLLTTKDGESLSRSTLQTYVSRIAKKIKPKNSEPTSTNGEEVKRLISLGRSDTLRYRFKPQPGDDVDLFAWRSIVTKAASFLDLGQPWHAALMLEPAKEMWSEPPLHGLPELDGLRDQLLGERLRGLVYLAEAQLWLKQYDQIALWLPEVLRENPLHDELLALLMKALYHMGLQTDARQHYNDYRARLKEEMGPHASPRPIVSKINDQILSHDPALDPPPLPRMAGDEAVRHASGGMTKASPPRMIACVEKADEIFYSAADAAAVEIVRAVDPSIVELAEQNSSWGKRVARRFVAEGISQIFEIGAGAPSRYSLHNAIRALESGVKFLYVSPDPYVVKTANRMLADDANVSFAPGDLREPTTIIEALIEAGFDLKEPVGCVSRNALNYVAASEDVAGLVRFITRSFAEGSQFAGNVAVAEGTTDEVQAILERSYRGARPQLVIRSIPEARDILDGDGLILRDGLLAHPAEYWPDHPGPPPGTMRAVVGVSYVDNKASGS